MRAPIFVLLVVFCAVANAFSAQRGQMKMALADYKTELAKTAAAIAAPGLCILTHKISDIFF